MPGSIQHLDHAGGGTPLPAGGAEADFAREVASLQAGGADGTDPAAAAYKAIEDFLGANIMLFAPPQFVDQTNFDLTKTSIGSSEDQNRVG